MTYQYHDESIIKNLPEDTVFVFGSNMAGTHQGGAAKIAHQYFGAMKGVGRGWSGQSFAIPTMNEHLQQMPLSQIQHYVDDFKIYTKNHPKTKYFVTAVGCGVAGYKVEEIAPMFKGISHNVIFPVSFRPFVEKTLPKLTQHSLQAFIQEAIIFSEDLSQSIQALDLNEAEKSLAKIVINTPMYPTDSNGRDRSYEITDILNTLKNKNVLQLDIQTDATKTLGGVILAILELYTINEHDFIEAWQGQREIMPPKAANRAKK
ncbi:hypothetical protein A7P53_11825 [Acinetobacter defluvii]|uniref:Macro domain-containing protein n=1 Tax=Acinetobacter defluvii TaxID=1871111 RepID=A0A2S2FBZ4_9GAMM|nr:hypothetical protein [Acinetobacter defluvii]AWL28484.1 hypothetical protein DJ533_07865 [Acinetobacter defluvii]NNP73252.1 hypothetical protein [Acinetobacter defluvii]